MANTMIFSGSASMTDRASSDYDFEKGDFTLHCWMSTTGFGPLFTQVSSGLSVTVNPSGSIGFALKSHGQVQVVETSKTGFNDGKWHHVTAVKSNSELALFINGKQLSTTQRWMNAENTGLGENAQHLIAELGPIGIWSKALTAAEVRSNFLQPPAGTEPGLISAPSFSDGASVRKIPIPADYIYAKITISNTTGETLEKQPIRDHNNFYSQFPQQIEANGKAVVTLENIYNVWGAIQCTVPYENSLGRIEIEVLKTMDVNDSGVTVRVEKDLIDELDILLNTTWDMSATVIVAESLVMVMMKNFYNFLNGIHGKLRMDQVVTGGGNLFEVVDYNKACQIFNLYFELKPLAIVYCESTEEVQLVYKTAIANNLPIRVRSGGHDHEGESSGTDTILIDMSRIDHVNIVRPQGETGPAYAKIGPGIRFISLTTILAKQKVMIPHGTCATVGIAGFTMGGGWGPWTRKEGMCCERLMGATIVLGDGSVQKLDATSGHVPELLWALRGGGGMSYGIVTELVIETFPLPANLIKFEAEWNEYAVQDKALTLSANNSTPTMGVLKAWENVILSPETPKLIGTNLKIAAKNWDKDTYADFDENTVSHNCIMYGYWEGDKQTLTDFMNAQFRRVPGFDLRIDGEGGSHERYGTRQDYGSNLMSNWDRESFSNVQRLLKGEKSKPLPPDLDAPAPHKITSRLVDHKGLSQQGYKALLESLTSPLVSTQNRALGLFSYITLGAIAGDFYRTISPERAAKSAFPYKGKLYTIQYQTWWNEKLTAKEEGQDNKVYEHTNRAQDWMEVCRDFDIPGTSGAFISFKDSSVPTSVYFDKSYEKLIQIKKDYSRDPKNHFRTRKTII